MNGHLSLKWTKIYQKNVSRKLTRVAGARQKQTCQERCQSLRRRYISACVVHQDVHPCPVYWAAPRRRPPSLWSLTCWRLMRPLFRNEYWRLFFTLKPTKISFNLSSVFFYPYFSQISQFLLQQKSLFWNSLLLFSCFNKKREEKWWSEREARAFKT